MKTAPKLVDLEELRALITALELGDPKRNEYIIARWLKYVEWWDSRARGARWRYFSLRGAVVIASALVPAFIGLRELSALGEGAWVFSVASIIASLVVAICAGLESLYSYGEIWREKRAAAELIKSEGFRFFQLAGDYNQTGKSHKELYGTFAAKVEEIIAREIKDYVVAVRAEAEPKRQSNGLTV